MPRNFYGDQGRGYTCSAKEKSSVYMSWNPVVQACVELKWSHALFLCILLYEVAVIDTVKYMRI